MSSKLKSKLFSKFEVSQTESNSIVGGLYTSAGVDTDSGGGRSDISFETTNKDGGNIRIDTNMTSYHGGTEDAPVITLD